LAVGLANVAKIKSSEEPGFAEGTHGKFVNFGSGTSVTLHGKERVMTEAEGRAEGSMIGSLISEVRQLRGDMRRERRRLPLDLVSALQTRGV
jgi:hypothetical protein